MLIKLLQKMGKKAQLWSFDKAPLQKKAGSYPRQKQTSHWCCESSDSEDDCDTDFHDSYISWQHKLHRARYGQRSKKSHGRKYHTGFTNKHATAAAPPVTGYHQPMPGYQPFTGYHFPMQYQPVPYARYARPVPCHGYYGQVQPVPSTYWHPHFYSKVPEQNPMIHYTSYADNYRYTV